MDAAATGNAKSPADAIKAGLALVPEDRKKDGLVLGLDVQTNICLTTLADMEDTGHCSITAKNHPG